MPEMKFFFLRLATPPLSSTNFGCCVSVSLQRQKQSNTAETQAPTAAKLLKRATNNNNNNNKRGEEQHQ
jgi:hypothetical protein